MNEEARGGVTLQCRDLNHLNHPRPETVMKATTFVPTRTYMVTLNLYLFHWHALYCQNRISKIVIVVLFHDSVSQQFYDSATILTATLLGNSVSDEACSGILCSIFLKVKQTNIEICGFEAPSFPTTYNLWSDILQFGYP